MAMLALAGFCLIKYKCCTLIGWYALYAFLIRYFLSYIKIKIIYPLYVTGTHGSRRHQVEKVWELECWTIWIITWQQHDEKVEEKSTEGWLRYTKPFPREYSIKHSPLEGREEKSAGERARLKGLQQQPWSNFKWKATSNKSPLKIRSRPVQTIALCNIWITRPTLSLIKIT